MERLTASRPAANYGVYARVGELCHGRVSVAAGTVGANWKSFRYSSLIAPRANLLSLCRLIGCSIPFASVPWHRKPGFKLIAIKDVRRLTGLEPWELLSRPNTQRLTRTDESGAREEFVRVPVELLIEEPAD